MIAEKLFLKTLEKIQGGRLIVNAPSGDYIFGEPSAELSATLIVKSTDFFSKAVFGGDDGVGDSYVDGDWYSPDLVALIRLAVRNLDTTSAGSGIWSATSRWIAQARHRLRSNTIAGSRRNIAAHYDLSNEFFRLFLDRNMLYSCAVYESENDSLEAAQQRKIDRICQKLELSPADHVLEIGTGWGAFAEHAATCYGCRVTTTTISREQHSYAAARFASLRRANRIHLLDQDYRMLQGRFDKIVSIEMFEAVGLDHYDEFFGTCQRLLEPHGAMLLQTITMNERRFPEYHRRSDWIQRRIFPGAELAAMSEILRSLGRVTSLSLVNAEDIGMHYALTLAEWRRRFHDVRAEAMSLGFDERFIRLWDYYLAYCEGAFRERYIGDSQLLMVKMHQSSPNWAGPSKAESAASAQGSTVSF